MDHPSDYDLEESQDLTQRVWEAAISQLLFSKPFLWASSLHPKSQVHFLLLGKHDGGSSNTSLGVTDGLWGWKKLFTLGSPQSPSMQNTLTVLWPFQHHPPFSGVLSLPSFAFISYADEGWALSPRVRLRHATCIWPLWVPVWDPSSHWWKARDLSILTRIWKETLSLIKQGLLSDGSMPAPSFWDKLVSACEGSLPRDREQRR